MTAFAGLETAGKEPASPPPSSGRARGRWTPYFLLLPGMAWLGVFFLVPVVFLVSTSLQTGNIVDGYEMTWSFSTYVDAITQYWDQFARSFVYALIATVAALLIAYPLAYAIAFKAGRFKNLLLVMVIAPFFTSFLIRTLAWQVILQSDGFVVGIMDKLHIISLLQWLQLIPSDQVIFSPFAVITGLTYNFLPFMTLPLYASLERLDPRLLEAGGDLYAKPFTSFRKITLPLSMPGVVAGTLLTFIPAAGDYINSHLLGNTSTTMIGQVIEGQFLRVLDYPTAAALSVTLMATIVVLVAVYVWRAGTEELV